MCKFSSLRNNVLIAGFFYFAANFNYYGSGYALQGLKGSIYVNSAFSAVGDLTGNALVKPVLAHWKRKFTFFVTFFVTCLVSVAFVLIDVPE